MDDGSKRVKGEIKKYIENKFKKVMDFSQVRKC